MPLDIVILGPPGAGKGTQAKRIADEVGIPHVATGDMLREAIYELETPLGRKIRPIYEAGDLVSDEDMIGLIRERLQGEDTAGGFVLDGFPRTLPQAEALDAMLADLDREISLVLDFHVSDEVAVERLVGRARDEGRSDDAPDVIRHRLEVFKQKTEPLISYYRSRGLLVNVEADRPVDDVFAEIAGVLEAATA
jgi:adenylate kinase